MTFRVGQKVVCVDDSNANWKLFPICSFPRVGIVYTVRDIGDAYSQRAACTCLRLQEIVNKEFEGKEPNFRASRFRPIVERKTSIEIFKAMLNPQEVEA